MAAILGFGVAAIFCNHLKTLKTTFPFKLKEKLAKILIVNILV